MYKVNGIDLTTYEFEELKLLVSHDGDNLVEFAESRLYEEKPYVFNQDAVFCYLKLWDSGLISGNQIMGGFRFTGLTYRGRNFVSDYEHEQKQLRQCVWCDRSFQLGLSLITFLLSLAGSLIVAWVTAALS